MSIFDDDSTIMVGSNEGFGVMDAPMAGSLLPSFSSAMSWPESFEEAMDVAYYQWDPHYRPHADEDEHHSFMRKMKEAAAFNEWVQRGSESSHAQGAADKTLESTDEGDSFLRKTLVHGGGGGGGPAQRDPEPPSVRRPGGDPDFGGRGGHDGNSRNPGTDDGDGHQGNPEPPSGRRPQRDPDDSGNRGGNRGSDGSGGRDRGPGNAGTDETQEDETQGDSDDRVPGERLNPPKVPMPNTWDERLPLEIPGTNGVRIPGAGARNPDYNPPRYAGVSSDDVAGALGLEVGMPRGERGNNQAQLLSQKVDGEVRYPVACKAFATVNAFMMAGHSPKADITNLGDFVDERVGQLYTKIIEDTFGLEGVEVKPIPEGSTREEVESTVGKNPAMIDYEQNAFWGSTTLQGKHGVSYFDGEMHDPYMSRRGDTYETIRGQSGKNTSKFDDNVGGWYFVVPEEED